MGSALETWSLSEELSLAGTVIAFTFRTVPTTTSSLNLIFNQGNHCRKEVLTSLCSNNDRQTDPFVSCNYIPYLFLEAYPFTSLLIEDMPETGRGFHKTASF